MIPLHVLVAKRSVSSRDTLLVRCSRGYEYEYAALKLEAEDIAQLIFEKYK